MASATSDVTALEVVLGADEVGLPLAKILCLVRGVTQTMFNCLLGASKPCQCHPATTTAPSEISFPLEKIKCLLFELVKGIVGCFFGISAECNCHPTKPNPEAEEALPISPSKIVCIGCTIIKSIVHCFVDNVECNCHSDEAPPNPKPLHASAKFQVDSYVQNKMGELHEKTTHLSIAEIVDLVVETAKEVIENCIATATNHSD